MKMIAGPATVMVAALFFNAASAIEITSGPYLQNVTDHEATVMWLTDCDALSWVEIAPDDSLNFYAEQRPQFYETDMGRAVTGRLHKVRIRNLEPGKSYRYRVYSRKVLDEQPYYVAYGETAATDVYHKQPLKFSTVDISADEVSFMVVNDIHEDSLLFENLMKDFSQATTDFVVFNGDMLNFMGNEDQLIHGLLDRATARFASETPFYMVRGNPESRGNFAKNYMRYFETPTGKPYYTFRRGPVFFVVLDGGEDKPDNDIEYSGTSFCDDFRQEQADWLKKVVETEDFKSAPFRIAVVHVPPVQDTWHGPLHAKKLFLPIFNSAGIDLMLCAHLHRHAYNEAGVDGAAFPVLINSNDEGVRIEADSKEMKLTVKDRSGKVTMTKNYKK